MDECDTRRLCTRAQVTKSYVRAHTGAAGPAGRDEAPPRAHGHGRSISDRLRPYGPYRVTVHIVLRRGRYALTLYAGHAGLGSARGLCVEGQGVRGAPARAGPVRRDRSGHIRYSLISVRLAYNVNSRASLARPAGTRTGPPHAPIARKGRLGRPCEYDRPGLPARADRRARTTRQLACCSL